MAKYKALHTMNALVAGRAIRLEKDKLIDLTAEEAADLVRAGYVNGPLSAPRVEIIEDETDETVIAERPATEPSPKSEPTPLPTSRRNRAKTLGKLA